MSDELKKLEQAVNNAASELAKSYQLYNELVQSVIETVERDYVNVYSMKRAILETLSKHLHGK